MFIQEMEFQGYMFEKVDILGIKIANLTIDEIVEILISSSKEKRTRALFTPNSEIIENFRKDSELVNILNSADILSADGIGVVWAAKTLKNPLRGRAAGFDIASKLLEMPHGLSFFFFGGSPGIAENAKDNLEMKYPHIKIAGTRDGYNYDENVWQEINAKNPDIIFVCLGAEKQERWIHENKAKFEGKILMGIGGSLDVFAGKVKRAPDIFIKLRIEWLYRLIKQPSRFIRMLSLPRFCISVLIEKGRLKNRPVKQKKRGV